MVYLIGYGLPLVLFFFGVFILIVVFDKIKSSKKGIDKHEKRGVDKYFNSSDYE